MTIFNTHMVADFSKRYLTNVHLESFLKRLNPEIFNQSIAGYSVENRPIYRLDFGSGSFKILLWSQMHGNETTTTKAVIDLLNELNSNLNSNWLSIFSFTFLPLLNPDGAENYTRVNANQVDLNRDSIELSQPESRVLREIIEEVKPNLALNMHDQRTIFSAGPEANPATISFLAPSFNESREVNEVRLFAMKLIAAMNSQLQKYIPNQVGRFDDAFNINCIGDYCTQQNIPTILFEAGHFQEDYQREMTRNLVLISLKHLIDSLISEQYTSYTLEDYLKIPENEKNFVDIIVENFSTTNDELIIKGKRIPFQLKEVLKMNNIEFFPEYDDKSAPNFRFGHKTLNLNSLKIESLKELQKIVEKSTQ